MSEIDARGAAFAPRPSTFTLLQWGGFEYEVRPTTLATQKKLQAMKEGDPTTKALELVISCTYWPPGSPQAGKRMFSDRDREAILETYGDEGSLWTAIIRAVGARAEKANASTAVESEVGNSEASPGASQS